VEPCRVNRGFEHGVSRTVEADEFSMDPTVHDGHVNARTWRCGVDRAGLDFPPRAAIGQYHASDRLRRLCGVSRI